MSKFVLVEHSLRRVGGHFFQYAQDILSAAEQAGFEPVLATHRSFREPSRFPTHWPIHSIFPFDWERIHRVQRSFHLSQLRFGIMQSGMPSTAYHRVTALLADRFKPAISKARYWRHRKRIRGYSEACSTLFNRIGTAQGDQVFCATMGDADLLGLARFLKSHQATQLVDWHLQFHMDLLPYQEMENAAALGDTRGLRRRFARALNDLTGHRVRLYTTTNELTQQYNRLGVANFTTLPWPVGAKFAPEKTCADTPRPLRVVCAGDFRREKGAAKLAELVEQLWDDYLANGRVQLLFQLDEKRRSAKMLGLRRPVVTSDSADPARLPQQPLVAIRHPLDPDDYAMLIRNAHVGLLMYDADKYYARCSGILVEFLSAGVPVITPSDCWLSRQFEARRHVGLTANNQQQVSQALRKIVDDHPRFKLAAERFAVNWRRQHSPTRTIEMLCGAVPEFANAFGQTSQTGRPGEFRYSYGRSC